MSEKLNEKKIIVLNDEIYALSPSAYEKAMGDEFNTPHSSDKFDEMHEKRCERVRKYGKKILDADRVLRDD